MDSLLGAIAEHHGKESKRHVGTLMLSSKSLGNIGGALRHLRGVKQATSVREGAGGIAAGAGTFVAGVGTSLQGGIEWATLNEQR